VAVAIHAGDFLSIKAQVKGEGEELAVGVCAFSVHVKFAYLLTACSNTYTHNLSLLQMYICRAKKQEMIGGCNDVWQDYVGIDLFLEDIILCSDQIYYAYYITFE